MVFKDEATENCYPIYVKAQTQKNMASREITTELRIA